MRKLLNHLLGEELVSKHSDRGIREALISTAMGIAFTAICLFAVYVFG